MTAPVSIPVSVFTAGHGYDWSTDPAGIERETMDGRDVAKLVGIEMNEPEKEEPGILETKSEEK